MADILIPEAVLDEFLQSLHAKLTRDCEDLVAKTRADLAAFRARLDTCEAMLRAQPQTTIAGKDKIALRKMRAAENELVRKVVAAEKEIARLRLARSNSSTMH